MAPPPTARTPTASGASHITTLVVVYLLLPKHVFVLHFLTLKGKGGELYLVGGVYSQKRRCDTFLLVQEADRTTPLATLELPADTPLPPICFCWLD